jgi:sensor histidine kinase regulating citrate/malate metabolism
MVHSSFSLLPKFASQKCSRYDAAECNTPFSEREYVVSAVLSRRGQKGLGLVGIQERVNAMGGTLRIQSATGQGTQLRITIPMEK